MDNILIFIPVKNEINRLNILMPQLSAFYPTEKIVLYSNGSSDESVIAINSLASQYNNVETIFTTDIYQLSSCGVLFRDILNTFIKHQPDYILRIDTDVQINQRVDDFSGYEGSIFGCVHYVDENGTGFYPTSSTKVFAPYYGTSGTYFNKMPTYVNGIIGFSSRAMYSLLGNDTFSESNDITYADLFQQERAPFNPKKHKFSLDYILMSGLQTTNIPLLDHPQIYSVTYLTGLNTFISNQLLDRDSTLAEINNKEKYAFVHPVNRANAIT